MRPRLIAVALGATLILVEATGVCAQPKTEKPLGLVPCMSHAPSPQDSQACKAERVAKARMILVAALALTGLVAVNPR